MFQQRSLQVRSFVLGALVAAATVLACAGTAASSSPTPRIRAGVAHAGRCLGRPATIVGHGKIHGTAHADVIVGRAGEDHIFGGGGNDRICAGGGDDTIEGGTGSDLIDTGAGDDGVIGGWPASGPTPSSANAATTVCTADRVVTTTSTRGWATTLLSMVGRATATT